MNGWSKSVAVNLIETESAPIALTNGAARIDVRGVSKWFGEKEVLRSVDLSIDAGEFVAIVGRSGCGKSTLLRILAGLETPTDGTVFVDGSRLNGLNASARVMFQDARLMPWMSVAGNVGLGLNGKWESRALSVLAEVGLDDRAKEWPRILSGGQRQRVALARALASEPPFLLLDEPLGALDALTRLEMQALLERIWQKHRFTALLITHDIEEAVALGDRVVLIDEGQIALDVAVPLERPRDRGDEVFVRIRKEVLNRVTIAR